MLTQRLEDIIDRWLQAGQLVDRSVILERIADAEQRDKALREASAQLQR